MWQKTSAPTPCPPAVGMAEGPHPLLQAYGDGQDLQRSGVALRKLSLSALCRFTVGSTHL